MPINKSESFPGATFAQLRNLGDRIPNIGLIFLGLCALTLSLSVAYWLLNSQTVFSTTASPNQTYILNLKGSKGRALFARREVRVDVLKKEQPFASDIWLHSAENAFDLSFEAGYPDLRWLKDNCVEFYRQQYFEGGSDHLTIRNSSQKHIKYIRVQSLNKFLLFDVEPAASILVKIPAPRGDSQWIAVEGVFSDGQIIPFNYGSFDRQSSHSNSVSYRLEITSSDSLIEPTETTRID